MQFCDACGSMMIASGDHMTCTNQDCGRQSEREMGSEFVSTTAQADEGIIESDVDAAFEGKPTANVYCESCEHERAWYTIKQTGAADEPPTRFYKCTQCGHRWRGYN